MGRLILLSGVVGLLGLTFLSRATFAADVPQFGVFELTFTSDEAFDNPFWDPVVSATFTSPKGKALKVEGFYFGGKEWKVRFVPGRQGKWTYAASMAGKARPQQKKGEFTCVKSPKHGFLRISKVNPYRFEYDDGKPFYPVGYQHGGVLSAGHDGPGPNGKWRSVPLEERLKALDGAANLSRVQLGCGTTAGCALMLLTGEEGLDRYDVDAAAKLDEACRLYDGFNVSQILILFQDMSTWGRPQTAFGTGSDTQEYKSVKAKNMPLQEKYVRYVVARYGAYVDIWELFNEDSFAPNDYLAHLAKVVREADPYDHPITTNYERPDQDWCEIVCPHNYMSIPAGKVDAHLVNEITRLKSFGKPVQYTEFGNKGMLSNYDPVKWRVAVWTCYIREAGMLFWSMSGRKTDPTKWKGSGNANAYLGPESRKFFRIHLDFVKNLPVDMRPINCGFNTLNHDPEVRVAGLGNGDTFVVYLNHSGSHKTEVQPKPLRLWTGPGRFKVTCIDPATGEALREYESGTRQFFLQVSVPPMKVDHAVKLERMRPE